MGKSSGGVRNSAIKVEKGTDAYLVAQNYSNKLAGAAENVRQPIMYGSGHIDAPDEFNMHEARQYVEKVAKTKGFGAEVAKTVLSRSGANSYNIARMSDKQAWAIARAGVENRISYNDRRLDVKKEASAIRQERAERNQSIREGRKKYYDALKKWSERKKQRNNK